MAVYWSEGQPFLIDDSDSVFWLEGLPFLTEDAGTPPVAGAGSLVGPSCLIGGGLVGPSALISD